MPSGTSASGATSSCAFTSSRTRSRRAPASRRRSSAGRKHRPRVARLVGDALKLQRAREWLEFLWDTKRGRLSRQVLHEYYVTVTRKLSPGLPVNEARSDVRALFQWLSAVDPAVLIESAWAFQDRSSLSFWDALILGAAQSMGCGSVLSEDLPEGQEIEGIRIVNPFSTRPSERAG